MKFNFKKKHNDVKLGDVLFSHASELYYMVIKDYTSPTNFKYKLLCLNDAEIWSKSFECIDDMINYQFSNKQYDVIQKENLVLSDEI